MIGIEKLVASIHHLLNPVTIVDLHQPQHLPRLRQAGAFAELVVILPGEVLDVAVRNVGTLAEGYQLTDVWVIVVTLHPLRYALLCEYQQKLHREFAMLYLNDINCVCIL